ncbi:hypothetical protein [Robiginitalea aurantiaca]|uniref:Uncharacterized protein n=1 Tax=Robiginitalea aurantiaca TaxID=3056915 RepID=A0ABT7WBD5_9FLAO|nr:hypothetical protein [Robiginitalea aurantiaca]MDM9630230.1 hypothetical protein [Robiginitalea aurantiaca]
MESSFALKDLIKDVVSEFARIKNEDFIITNSVPVLWFGNYKRYLKSERKIVTVALNPSLAEFIPTSYSVASPGYRFPSYRGTVSSLINSYNEYFRQNPYKKWFNPSFERILNSFNASFYNGVNTALHTDIGSPFATDPTWSKLSELNRSKLESFGVRTWHKLIQILAPEIVLYSASSGFENKIKFPELNSWEQLDLNGRKPLLRSSFSLGSDKVTHVLFQVQGRKPFGQMSNEERDKISKYLPKQ